MSHELVINAPRRTCCGMTANECTCDSHLAAETPMNPDEPEANTGLDQMPQGMDHLFATETGSVTDRTNASQLGIEPLGGMTGFPGRQLDPADNPLTANERAAVIPAVEDSDDEPKPRKVKTHDQMTLNDDGVNALLFGNNFAN